MEKWQTQPTSKSGYGIPSKFGKKTKSTIITDFDNWRDQKRIQTHLKKHPEDRSGFKQTRFGLMQKISSDRLPSQRKKIKKVK